ncbi:MAG TPA: glycosyltransferase family 4 protein [Beijerinckiaceae bacterium]|jgi:glycosyltransferase involved in cell wall biosynthesis
MKVAFVTNIVTPYTHRLFERLGEAFGSWPGGRPDSGLHVFACSDVEPGRHWDLEPARQYQRSTLAGLRLHRSYVSHLYLNLGIVPALATGGFDRVIISDFSPTMVLARWIAALRRIPVLITTDGQPSTDPGRTSRVHRLARQLVVPGCVAGVGASRGSLALLESYGLPRDAGFISPIAPGWDFPGTPPGLADRPYDLLFCGHLDEDRKGALFFADVVDLLVARGRRPTVRVAGNGPLRSELEDRLRVAGVEARFDGYLPQDALAEAYASAKLFLFPSRGDPWGLVANEAIQSGTPVLVSPHAQAGLELVGPSRAGEVLPLTASAWADAAEHLLTDPTLWEDTHARALLAAPTFTLDAMARGFLEACAYEPPCRQAAVSRQSA